MALEPRQIKLIKEGPPLNPPPTPIQDSRDGIKDEEANRDDRQLVRAKQYKDEDDRTRYLQLSNICPNGIEQNAPSNPGFQHIWI